MKLFTCLLLFAVACLQGYAQSTAPLFSEGTIEYRVDVSDYYNRYDFGGMKNARDMFGNRMVYTFKKGNLRYDFIKYNGDTVFSQIHDRKQNKTYQISSSDTMYYTITDGKSFRPIWSKTLGDTTINGIQLKGYGVAATNVNQTGTTIITRTYFYNKLPIKKKWFKNYADFDWNKAIALNGCLPGHYITDYVGDFRIEYYEPKVTRKKIDNTVFQLPKNKIIKRSDY